MHMIEGALLIAFVMFVLVRIMMVVLKRMGAYGSSKGDEGSEPKNASSTHQHPQDNESFPAIVRFSRGRANETHCYCHIIYTLSSDSNNNDTTEDATTGNGSLSSSSSESSMSSITLPPRKKLRRSDSPPPPYYTAVALDAVDARDQSTPDNA